MDNAKVSEKDLTPEQVVHSRCVKHAKDLLDSAKLVLVTAPSVAFHLALVALEELGKGQMVAISSFPDAPGRDRSSWIDSHADDHEKKLFWALWHLRPGNPHEMVTHIQESQEIARNLHNRRLRALYVDTDPSIPPPGETISADEAQNLIGLVDARMKLAELTKPRALDPAETKDLTWFLEAAFDPRKRGLIWGAKSVAKLKELGGDIGTWITWMKEQFDTADAENQAMAERELARARPEGEERFDPKWRIRLRLHSASHTMSNKVLKAWNNGVEQVKLFRVDKYPHALDVDILGPKNILAGELYGYGYHMARCLVAALNIGTFGFWWWYLPEYVAKFYGQMFDSEYQTEMGIERTPKLEVDWKGGPLSDVDSRGTLQAMAMILRMTKEEFIPIETYLRGCALLAKNDVFLQFEPNIFECFFQALREASIALGDWDGQGDYRPVWDRLTAEIVTDEKLRDEYYQRGLNVSAHAKLTYPITLEHAAFMKVITGAYLLRSVVPFFEDRGELKKQTATEGKAAEDS